MASQTAAILNQFRQSIPGTGTGAGLERGVQNFLAMQRQGRQQRLEDLQMKQIETQIDQDKLQAAKDALYPVIAAGLNAGPEGWAERQRTGMVPDDMSYEDAEAFMMGYMKDKAFDLVEVSVPGTEQTEFVQPWEAVGRRGKPRKPLVQVGGELETEERKAYGKSLVTAYEQLRDQARASETALLQYEMAKNIDIDQSGPLEAWKASIGAVAEDIGVDPATLGLDNIDNTFAYQGILQNMVLTKMQAQKGPQTENDARRIESTLATIGNPEEARQFLLDAGQAMEEMNVAQRDFWSKWRDTHGTFDGAEKAWSKFRAKTPFLAKNPKTGRPVFFTDFVRKTQAVNPDAEYGQIVDLWQKKYGRSN